MAWEVQDFQEQVEVMTGHANVSDKVMTWVSRTLMEVASKTYWTKQVKTEAIAPSYTDTPSTTVTENWATWTTFYTANPMALHRLSYVTTADIRDSVLVRESVQDFYAKQHAVSVTYSEGDADPARYCVPMWSSYQTGTAGDYYFLPSVAHYPQSMITTVATALTHLELGYLSAPNKMTAATGAGSSNWMTDKYPMVVLAGVMRYASLYIGDAQAYRIWKGKYENGLKDMLMNEEMVVASTPSMRAVYPEDILRGGQ